MVEIGDCAHLLPELSTEVGVRPVIAEVEADLP